jgi:hypothetical protein
LLTKLMLFMADAGITCISTSSTCTSATPTACQQHYLIRTVPNLLLAERGRDFAVVSDFDQTWVDAVTAEQLSKAVLVVQAKQAAAADSADQARIQRDADDELRDLNMRLQCVEASKAHHESQLADDPAELARMLNERVQQWLARAEVARRKMVFTAE